jgi:hypothetical protein
MDMLVEFHKSEDARLCGWVATPPHRRSFQGTTMAAGRDIPHDLVQFTIERALDIRDGFWGLLANGGWFASVPGRRPTRTGREIVRAHYDALLQVETVVNGHYLAWHRKEETPVGPALDAMYARWLAVAKGGGLVLEWTMHPLPGASGGRTHRQARPPRTGRRVRGAV